MALLKRVLISLGVTIAIVLAIILIPAIRRARKGVPIR